MNLLFASLHYFDAKRRDEQQGQAFGSSLLSDKLSVRSHRMRTKRKYKHNEIRIMPFAIDLKFIYEPLTTNEEVAKPNTQANTAMPCLRMQYWLREKKSNDKRKNPNKRQWTKFVKKYVEMKRRKKKSEKREGPCKNATTQTKNVYWVQIRDK